MFKVKISLIYFVLVCLLGGASYIFVNELENRFDGALQGSVEHANRSFLKLKELERQEMRQQVSLLANSAIKAQLGVLFRNRNILAKIQEELAKIAEREQDGYVRRVHGETLGRIAREIVSASVGRIGGSKHGNDTERKDAEQRIFNRLVRCSPNMFSCFQTFTHEALRRDVVDAIFPEEKPNLVLIVNNKGIGITAHHDDKWPSKDELRVHNQIPAVLQVKDGSIRYGVYYDAIRSSFFFIAVAPIFYSGEFAGSVVLGRQISKDMLKKEAATIGQKLAYVYDTRIATSSAEDSGDESYLNNILKTLLGGGKGRRESKIKLVAEGYIAYFNRLSQYSTPRKSDQISSLSRAVDFRYLLVLDRGALKDKIASMRAWILFLTVLVFVIGMAFIHLFFNQYVSNFKRIDQGVHELINGNRDYEFPFDYGEELPSSMAQSLNIMLAILLDRPLPEDQDESHGDWSDEMFVEEASGARPLPKSEADSASRQVSAVVTKQELAQEPAETYYKRIYNEYVNARAQLGQSSERVTYMKFIEKLVKNEALLKKKYSCKAVRFAVVIKDGKVTLKPIQID